MDCMDSSVVQFYRAALWAAAPSKRLCCVTLCRCVSHCWTCGSGASSCCCWLWSESCRLVSEAHCPPCPPPPMGPWLFSTGWPNAPCWQDIGKSRCQEAEAQRPSGSSKVSRWPYRFSNLHPSVRPLLLTDGLQPYHAGGRPLSNTRSRALESHLSLSFAYIMHGTC